ncbi:MAG TPA: carbohydrate ABC transporter permease [Ruminococcaceae bacterium]|jgi:multiple sugar transport system permease protein|nr:carbohydrate ABC transporter permease [Oscillospiraceae bacterium]
MTDITFKWKDGLPMRSQLAKYISGFNKISSDQKRVVIRRFFSACWSIFRVALLIGLAYVLLYPLLYMITMAIRDKNDMFDVTVNWIPRNITSYTLGRVWKAMEYPKTLLNTIFIVGLCSIVSACTCSLAGYGFARFKFKGQKIMFAVVIFTIIVPQSFYNMPTYINFRYFNFLGILDLYNLLSGSSAAVNLLNTRWTMILPALFGAGIRAGLYIYLFRQFFKSMPKELEEAAYIDGCGYLQTFYRVMVPASLSVFVTVFLFAFVWYWNDYQISGLLLGSDNMTLSSALSVINNLTYSLEISEGNHAVDTVRMALDNQGACLLVIAPLVLLYIFLQKYFVESIERTGLVE